MNGNATGGTIIWNLDVDDSKFQAGLAKAKRHAQDFGNDVDKEFSGMSQKIGRSLERATAGSAIFAGGLLAVGSALTAAAGLGVKTAGEFEVLQTALETVTGSSELAAGAMQTIKRVAKDSPFFEVSTLAKFTQLMAASGQSIDDAVQSGIRFGDVAAAFGKSNVEMARMGNTLSQVIGKGKADVVDFKELVNAGWVSVRKDTAAAMGVTMADFEELVSTGKVGYAEISKAAEKFAGSAEKQSGSLQSLFSRLKETISATLAEIVVNTGIFDRVKEAVKALITAIESIRPEQIQAVIKLLTDNLPIIVGLIIGGLIPAFVALAGFIGTTFGPLIAFLAIGAAIGFLVQRLVDLMGGWGVVMGFLQGIFAVFVRVFQAVLDLFNLLMGPTSFLASIYRNELNPAVNELKTAFADIWVAIQPLLPAFKALGFILLGLVAGVLVLAGALTVGLLTAFAAIVPSIIRFFAGVIGFWTGFFELIVGILTLNGDLIQRGFWNMWEGIKNTFIGGITAVLGFVAGFVIGIISFFQALYNALVGRSIVPDLVNAIVFWFLNLGARVVAAIALMVANVIAAFKQLFSNIIAEVSQWPGQLYQWGRNLIEAFARGIRDAAGAVGDAVRSVLNSAKRMLEGHSPPLEGPFKEIDKWGYNVGSSWVEGIRAAIGELSLDNPMLANAPVPAMAGGAAAGAGGLMAPGSLINIEHMEIRDESDITEVSRELAFRIETSSGFIDNG